MSEPIWVRRDVVLAIHNRQIAEHGSDAGVRDLGLLDSALARPRNRLAHDPTNTDIAHLAACYAYGLAKNHPFIDGNKRTAFVVCRTFLRLNGQDLSASGAEKYNVFYKLAAGEVSENELAGWIRSRIVKTP